MDLLDGVAEYISNTNSVLARKYKVNYKLGNGSFGDIFLATNRETGERVAVKFESAKATKTLLLNEYTSYRAVQHGIGIPQVYSCYTEDNVNVLVMELLGPSLSDLFELCDRHFSVKTVAILADQMIERLHHLHSHNIVHRDIKPDNFLMGRGDLGNRVFIIDFGLANAYWNTATDRHIQPRKGSHLVGTARYASINAMYCLEQSRRDDMEALGYVMMYLLRGNLPWQGIKLGTRKQRYEQIAEVKQSTRLEELCRDFPHEFPAYISYCRSLDFEEEPNYLITRQSFQDLLKRQGYTNNGIFDWTIKAQADEEEYGEEEEQGASTDE